MKSFLIKRAPAQTYDFYDAKRVIRRQIHLYRHPSPVLTVSPTVKSPHRRFRRTFTVLLKKIYVKVKRKKNNNKKKNKKKKKPYYTIPRATDRPERTDRVVRWSGEKHRSKLNHLGSTVLIMDLFTDDNY